MSKIIIRSAGFLSTVQDCGRTGFQRFGMPVSGAMDVYSLHLANLLAGNPKCAAAIEATLTGSEIAFSSDGAIAICGADFGASLNEKPVNMYETIFVKKGDVLKFSGLRNGCRTYIAFAGGIEVPVVMGSRSTYLRAKTGGMDGRALVAGDIITLGEISTKVQLKKVPKALIPDYSTDMTFRVIAGPEAKSLDFTGLRNFLTTEYRVTDQSDRMGLRLDGLPIKSINDNHDIISAGISPGTIQLPGSGLPIILMADRQTTGGYLRIANVISADLDRIAQLKPGDKIKFLEISLEKAHELFAERDFLINKFLI
ncbi:MAG: biotin-dependent carboxyltransferase family protein [Bacteroidales bacterium]|nr:biotin-dependent carboxyltransferase family protein [Bacteroidales bacterium]